MAHFKKTVLEVGTYHSPQGVVEVTPERLKHWESGVKQLQAARYAIPSHFDHSDRLEDLEPIAMDSLKRDMKRKRSAGNTVGRLTDFKVAEDGQSAEIIVETLREDAKQAVESNSVYVSPVIFPEWKDGAGRVYHDVITSVDLVDHPVDYSQSSFTPVLAMSTIPVIRMGLQPYRLGLPMEMEDEDKKKKPESESEDKPESDEPITMEMEAEDETLPDPEPAPEPAPDYSQALADVVGALAKMDIVLPEDTSPENFLDRLHVALLTAAAHQGVDAGAAPGDEQPEAATPAIATMSLAAQNALKFAEKQHNAQVSRSLDALLKTGRATPAEVNVKRRELSAIKLSLDNDGNPRASDVEKWIDSRRAVPKGTFWTPGQRSQFEAKRLSLVTPPEGKEATIAPNSNKLSHEQVQHGVALLTAHRKR